MYAKRHTQTCPTLVIVDPAEDDYGVLTDGPDTPGLMLFLKTGEQAMQVQSSPNTAWLININLPDVNGADLVEMLRQRRNRSFICLISDHYRPEDELTARYSGAMMYLCKPLSTSWLVHLSRQAVINPERIPDLEPRPPTPVPPSPTHARYVDLHQQPCFRHGEREPPTRISVDQKARRIGS